jgi:predicted membrane channel-forming protein YqfA (hemolysin III family)
MDLSVTLWAGALAGAIFVLCWLGERRPRRFGEVRLFPYIPVMMACLVAILVVLAHAVSLMTGKPVGSIQ